MHWGDCSDRCKQVSNLIVFGVLALQEVDKKKEAADAERAKAVENVPSALLRFYKK